MIKFHIVRLPKLWGKKNELVYLDNFNPVKKKKILSSKQPLSLNASHLSDKMLPYRFLPLPSHPCPSSIFSAGIDSMAMLIDLQQSMG